MTTRYVYGPVHSWCSGTSLGIDPIGSTSTCSFNCAYCQLGKIQNITQEIKEYVRTADVIRDLRELETAGQFNYENLDVITFAGSGEPTLAANLGEMILEIRKLYAGRSKRVPISILTNATMLEHQSVRDALLQADLISLKLDAANDEVLRSINQPASGITLQCIVSGIKLLQKSCVIASEAKQSNSRLQLQIMFMPKFIKDTQYLNEMIALIKDLGMRYIQINTPTRAKPLSKTGEYWLDTRGNHYGPGSKVVKPEFIEFTELPVISEADAYMLEDKLLAAVPELEIVNVYKR